MARDLICPTCGNHFLSSSSADLEPIDGRAAQPGALGGHLERDGKSGLPTDHECIAPSPLESSADIIGSAVIPIFEESNADNWSTSIHAEHMTVADSPSPVTITSHPAFRSDPAQETSRPPPLESVVATPAPLEPQQSVIDAPIPDTSLLNSPLMLGLESSTSQGSSTWGTIPALTPTDPNTARVKSNPIKTPIRSPDPDDDATYDEVKAPAWPLILLLSYASALTIACIWLVLKIRRFEPSITDSGPPPVDTRPDPGKRAERSLKLPSPPEIPKTHLIKLGEPWKSDALEILALEVVATRVSLVHSELNGDAKERQGGRGALALRIRLRNRSHNAEFAPLDEAFVRDRDRSLPDSFIESEEGERVYLFPLAVESEWSIKGQEFRILKPGESYETWIVSAPDSWGKLKSPSTWRLRVRSGIEKTDLVGIQFDPTRVPREPDPTPRTRKGRTDGEWSR